MIKYKKINILKPFACALGFIAISCSDPNFDIGEGLLPQSHEMRIISEEVDSNIFIRSTSLSSMDFEDKFNVANRSDVTLGAQTPEGLRPRKSGFFTKFTPAFTLEDEGFGYKPIADSVFFYPFVSEYSGDTTQVINYTVYEITDDAFLKTSPDSVFTLKQANALFVGGEVPKTPLFTFNYPNQNDEVYIDALYVPMDNITAEGEDFLQRLMLQKEGYTVDLYNSDYEGFVELFKGIYIEPTDEEFQSGSTVSFDLASSGFGFYARNVDEEDPQYIKDTLRMTYLFKGTLSTLGDVSISTIVREDIEPTQSEDYLYVEGMAGSVGQLVFGREFFEGIDQSIEKESVGEQSPFTEVFFNTFRLRLFLSSMTDYEFSTPPLALSEQINTLPNRLVLYKNYTNLTELDANGDEALLVETAVDYDYYNEIVSGISSPFGGYLNRSQGCYVMNIPLEMQTMWGEWQDLKANDGLVSDEEWAAVTWNKLILAPAYDNLMTPLYAKLWGVNEEGESTLSIQVSNTYTLLKR